MSNLIKKKSLCASISTRTVWNDCTCNIILYLLSHQDTRVGVVSRGHFQNNHGEQRQLSNIIKYN